MMCQSVPGQDIELQISPDVCEWLCEWLSIEASWGALDREHCITSDEQLGSLHGNLCHQRINVCEWVHAVDHLEW